MHRGDIRAKARENIDHAAGQVACGQDFTEGQRGQRVFFRGDYDAGVACEDGRRNEMDERKE